MPPETDDDVTHCTDAESWRRQFIEKVVSVAQRAENDIVKFVNSAEKNGVPSEFVDRTRGALMRAGADGVLGCGYASILAQYVKRSFDDWEKDHSDE